MIASDRRRETYLIDVSERLYPAGSFERNETGPGSSGEDGHEDHDADDISLQEGLSVVLGL